MLVQELNASTAAVASLLFTWLVCQAPLLTGTMAYAAPPFQQPDSHGTLQVPRSVIKKQLDLSKLKGLDGPMSRCKNAVPRGSRIFRVKLLKDGTMWCGYKG